MTRLLPGLLVGAPFAASGVALVAWAARADRRWFERHALPFYFVDQPTELTRMVLVRWAVFAAGAGLTVLGVFLARRVVRSGVQGTLAAIGRVGLAVALALAVGEAWLRWSGRAHVADALVVREAPLESRVGEPHPRYGWAYIPSRTTLLSVAGRTVSFAVNADRERAPTEATLPDPHAPTIVFTGESIAAGHGLEYEETFPAIVGSRLGLQTVNLAMDGYGNDQAYLRLVDELPKLDRVVAAVATFLPAQIARNVPDFRPRFVVDANGTLTLVPGAPPEPTGPAEILRLAKTLLPYHDTTALDVTAAIIRATHARIVERGAVALFVVISYGSQARTLDEHPDAWIVRDLFEKNGVPYELVDIDWNQTLPGDWHPSAPAARFIADRVASRLRAALR